MGGLVVCQDFAGLRRAVVFGYIKEKPRIGRCFDVAVGSQGRGHDTGVAGIGSEPRQIAFDKRGHRVFQGGVSTGLAPDQVKDLETGEKYLRTVGEVRPGVTVALPVDF